MDAPFDIGIIDTMVGFPKQDRREVYKFLAPHLRDKESLEEFSFPAQYMFKEVPGSGKQDDYIRWTVEQMDRFGRAQGVDHRVQVGGEAPAAVASDWLTQNGFLD